MRSTDWWDEHIVGALMSYWVYQHIGNLPPEEHSTRTSCSRAVQEADDARPVAARVRA